MAISPNASKVITGGRSVVSIDDGSGPQVIGIFESCTVNESITSEDIHILGRFSPDSIVLTGYSAVSVQCSGFRVYGAGLKKLGRFPSLQSLLGLGPITLTIADRENPTGAPLATIINCLPDTNSSSFQSRSTSKISISYKGTSVSDESTVGDAEVGAVSLNAGGTG